MFKNENQSLISCYLRFPDREVGQFPMAYVVRKGGSDLSENDVMDFVAKQVNLKFKLRLTIHSTHERLSN